MYKIGILKKDKQHLKFIFSIIKNKGVAGNSSKIYLVVDACGHPVHIEVTGGQLHDSQIANDLIKRAIKDNTEAVVAVKGYDSQDIRRCIMYHDATAAILVKSNSKSSNVNMD